MVAFVQLKERGEGFQVRGLLRQLEGRIRHFLSDGEEM
jgi:hypothetical protein